ncbi:transglutaminase-like domain-containing protein [Marinilactibacillus psychrotolerans]|uniref:transglutaminase-like domain-containing protein n=1 Tax=Marinilactibacillus psychrotolerans TaxID=191770 RepID=UPI003887C301
MNNYIHSLSDFSRSFILSIVHSFLLLPVLFLFLKINELTGFYYFALFFILTQIIASLSKKRWLYFLVQLGSTIFFLYHIFPSSNEKMNFLEWLSIIWQHSSTEWASVFSEHTSSVPVLLTSVSLLFLITLLTYTAIQQKIALPSFLVALGYLLVLHTFTSQSLLFTVVSVTGFGLLLIGLVRIDLHLNKFYFLKSAGLTTLLAALLIGVSYWGVGPLRSVQERLETSSEGYQRYLNEQGFFDWIRSNSPQSRYQKIGMDADDKELGGPLQNDFTPVFKVYTETPQYWKVLHRKTYTGIGWNSHPPADRSLISFPYQPENSDLLYGISSTNTSENQESITFVWENPLEYIAYPYGWSQLEMDDSPDDFTMLSSNTNGHHTVQDSKQAVSNYTITYDKASLGNLEEDTFYQDDGWRTLLLESLNSNPEVTLFTADSSFKEKMVQVFPDDLQLPSSLPQRVTDLALELTKDLESEYEMVRAIEAYLKNDGGYRYSLQEASQTPEGKDYVDQFLFETMVGYCDNFSTAMTVMLRSIDIPARWTKGFSPGSEQTDADGQTYYQITNANAHSWVEVYFPSTGWVPFDPSPSFSSPLSRAEEDTTSRSGDSSFNENDIPAEEMDEAEDPAVQTPEEEDAETPEGSEPTQTDEETVEEPSEYSKSAEQRVNFWSFLLIPLFILLVYSLYLFSIHLKVAIWILEKLIQKNQLSLLQASNWTMKLFQVKKKKRPNQTFENYFEYLGLSVSEHSDALNLLAHLLNQVFYGSETPKTSLSIEQKRILLDSLQILKLLSKYKTKNL